MTTSASVFEEPPLEFGYGQRAIDPHDGLSLFGPYDIGTSAQPKSANWLLIGTSQATASFQRWAALMNRPAAHQDGRKHQLWTPFPGYEAAFGWRWPETPTSVHVVDPIVLMEAARKGNVHERCFAIVDLFLAGLAKAQKLDEQVSLAVCVVPDEVWKRCRPLSKITDALDKSISAQESRLRQGGQADFFDKFDPDQYMLAPDFRRQLKARCMAFGIPIQIVRESTLRPSDEVATGERTLTPLSDRLWNLSTTIYYKCGGKPWRLATARDGVCYVGLAFRRSGVDAERTACCAAQMFLNTGDGIVFLGEYGPWYSPETHQFHLSKQAAGNLLKGVLETYASMGGKPLTEVFLHSRSDISEDEFRGYESACPSGTRVVGIRVRPERDGLRLFRQGRMPVLRGTFLKNTERSGFLFGAGFKPRLATYDGWETPVPLRIDIQRGEADITQTASDVYALTKLNYNACRLGEKQPVTVKFSDAVGEILIANPTVKERRANFKFYI